MLFVQDRIGRLRQKTAAVMIGQHLTQLLDPAQKLQPGRIGCGISRQDHLGDVADPADGCVHLFRVDRIAQPQDIGVGCHDRKT